MRATAAAIGLVLGCSEPPPHWCAGQIVRETWRRDGFRLEPLICDYGFRPPPVEVVYDGGLTDAICEGSDVEVQGRLVDGWFVAQHVSAVRLGRYDGDCYLTRCMPRSLRPEHCRG